METITLFFFLFLVRCFGPGHAQTTPFFQKTANASFDEFIQNSVVNRGHMIVHGHGQVYMKSDV